MDLDVDNEEADASSEDSLATKEAVAAARKKRRSDKSKMVSETMIRE
jgi:hypothetical protein